MEMWIVLAAAGSGYLAKYLQNNNNVQQNKESIATDGASVGDNKSKGFGRNFKTSGAGKLADCNCQTQTRRAILDKACPQSPTKEEGESSAHIGLFNEHLFVDAGISSSSDTRKNSCHSLQKPNVNFVVSQAEKIDVDANAAKTGTGTCSSFVPETLDCSDSLENNEKLREPDVRNGFDKLADGDQSGFPESRGKRTQQDIYAREIGVNIADIIEHPDDYDYMQADSGFGHMLQPDNARRQKFEISRFGRERKPFGRSLRMSSKLKPMSSLESCLVAQLTGENVKYHFDELGMSSSFLLSSVANQRPLIVTDGSRIISRGEGSPFLGLQVPNANFGMPCENRNIFHEDEPAYGLPSLPSVRGLKKFQGTGTELMRKLQISKQGSMSTQNSRDDDDVITAADSATQKRRKVYEYGSFTSSQVASDKPDTSAGRPLFSFGIGVGIMFAIISSRKEIERLNYCLRQTEELVEDLEEELKMHDSLTVKDLTGEAHDCVETWRHPFAEGHGTRHTMSSDGLPEAGCVIGERTSIEEPEKRMENMTRVEAELEAELEQLELNLKHQRKMSGLSEIDPDCIVDFVHGDLNADNLMGSTESDEDNSAFTHEEIHTGNYAVSPRDLARRLNEVRESRLHERIIELEVELEATQAKLRAFESGYQQSKGLNQDIQSFISGSEVPARRPNYLENQSDLLAGSGSSRKASSNIPINQKEGCRLNIKELSEGSGSQAVDLNGVCSEAEENQNTDDKESKDGQNLPLFLTLSGDALSAYNEAYDEFMKVSSEKGVTMFDSAEIKDVPPTKQSTVVDNQAHKYLSRDDSLESNDTQNCHCYKEDDFRQKDSKCISHSDPFLFSANYWNIMGPHTQGTQGSCSSGGLYSLTSPNQMELGSEGFVLKNPDFPDYVLEDTSGSTPCSLKFVDTSLIHSNCDHEKSLSMNIAPERAKLMGNMDTLCRKDGFSTNATAVVVEQFGLQMPSINLIHTGGKKKLFSAEGELPQVSTSVLDKIRCWDTLAIEGASEFVTDKTLCHEVGHRKMSDSEPHLFHQSNSTSDASEHVSDDDEQLGELLIKCIIEKRRQGTPIVEKAESILASLETNDQNF